MTFTHTHSLRGHYVIHRFIKDAEWRACEGWYELCFCQLSSWRLKWLGDFPSCSFSAPHSIMAHLKHVFLNLHQCARCLHARKAGVKVCEALNIMLHNTRFHNLRNCANSDSRRPRGATAALLYLFYFMIPDGFIWFKNVVPLYIKCLYLLCIYII